MDLITQFPLGDDIAWILLTLGVLAIAALVVGAVLPRRLQRDEDHAEVDADLGKRLGAQISSAAQVIGIVGLPLAALLLLAPGSTDDRLLRAGMLIVGLALGPLAAWRGLAVQIAALGIAAESRPALVSRLGALTVTGALGLAILPVVIVVWFLQTTAAPALVALGAGAAIAALALRACQAPVQAAASSSALLVGSDEHDLDADDPTNLGGPHLRSVRMLGHGGLLSADLVAITTAGAGLGLLLGVPVLAAEGIVVVLLALGIALLAAGIAAVIPHVGKPGRERAGLQLGGLLSAVLAAAGVVAAASLWVPGKYADLRFEDVGMANFTDPAITGGQPTPREQLEPQIEQALAAIGRFVSSTDDSQYASAFLDTLALYSITPNVVVAAALGIGALVALGAIWLLGRLGERQGPTVLRTARTSRTGGALGITAGLGSTALTAAGVLAAATLGLLVISVLSAGVPALALAMLALAGLGALVVVAAHAGSLLAPTLLDRRDIDDAVRSSTSGLETGPRGALLLAGTLLGLAALGPVISSLQLAPRAGTVWEDRALHAVTPLSLTLLGGIALGVVATLLVTSTLLDAARRLGASAVVETRACLLEGRDRAELPELAEATRRAVLPAVVIAVLGPIVAAFGLGPAALPGYLGAVVVVAAGLGLWTLASGTALQSAADLIADGRYGGRGSWGHSGAIGGTVLTTILRSAVGAVALPLTLVTALIAALGISTVVGMNTDGTSVYLRWGVAVVAILLALIAWVVAATAPEVDLEDEVAETSKPLFGRADEEAGGTETLDAMNWESDEERDIQEVEVKAPRRRGGAGKAGTSGAGSGDGVKSGAGTGAKSGTDATKAGSGAAKSGSRAKGKKKPLRPRR